MTAISKSWVTIADTAVDPDSPLDAQLMTGLRDDLVHLREWLGASYTAGAVQDHSHDGVNSALVPIGPNFLRNGSFEAGTAGWTLTQYTGGTVALSTTTPLDGANSLAFTSTVLANGGGDAVSNEYVPVTGGNAYSLYGAIQASVANISSKMEIIWYDNTKAPISASTVYSSSDTRTALTRIGGGGVAPATARFMRKKITGGVPATGSATGTIYFDGLVSDILSAQLKSTVFTASGTWTKPIGLDPDAMVMIEAWGGGGGGYTSGSSGGGGGGAYNRGIFKASTLGATETVTVGAGGAAGSSGGNTSFGSKLVACGGSPGAAGTGVGGAGGGTLSGSTGYGGAVDSGGTGGASSFSGSPSFFGGGGGGGGSGGAGASSLYGGGGGGGYSSGSGGASLYGGAGGAGGVAGSIPAGGGGYQAAGARGECRVWILI